MNHNEKYYYFSSVTTKIELSRKIIDTTSNNKEKSLFISPFIFSFDIVTKYYMNCEAPLKAKPKNCKIALGGRQTNK